MDTDHGLVEQLLFKSHPTKTFGSITMTIVTMMVMATFLGQFFLDVASAVLFHRPLNRHQTADDIVQSNHDSRIQFS